ncbi:MAG: aminotransferase class V-fold PLP-dependent enzyme [Bacteriovoracaceae bacterium]|nr:aminotransferase class V-fold PLP-dependent enzyme [Bacteriovoracaceae bacterium]
MLYFDHAASTPLNTAGLEVLKKSLEVDFANPSAAHKLGKVLLKRIEAARKTFLELLRATEYDFIFTSSATESNNTVIKGLELFIEDSVIASTGDHPSLSGPIASLKDFSLTELPLLVSGEVDYSALEKLDLSSITLLAIAHVNNHTGNIQDVERISQIIKSRSPKAHVHVDGVQSFGKIPFSLKGSAIDSYSISGHKIGASKGISGLYLKKGIALSSLLCGGGHEGGRRSSTLFAPLIFGFEATALDVFNKLEDHYDLVEAYYQKVKSSIERELPSIKFPFENVSPYILTFVVPKISSDIVMRHLERDDVFVASSSACSSKVKGFSPVYQALKLPVEEHKNVLRISFSYTQTENELNQFVDKFTQCLSSLKFLIK